MLHAQRGPIEREREEREREERERERERERPLLLSTVKFKGFEFYLSKWPPGIQQRRGGENEIHARGEGPGRRERSGRGEKGNGRAGELRRAPTFKRPCCGKRYIYTHTQTNKYLYNERTLQNITHTTHTLHTIH
jgi:hypothetical protein